MIIIQLTLLLNLYFAQNQRNPVKYYLRKKRFENYNNFSNYTHGLKKLELHQDHFMNMSTQNKEKKLDINEFLNKIDEYGKNHSNCIPGVELKLGSGVIDKFAKMQYKKQAENAVNFAKYLTILWKLKEISSQDKYRQAEELVSPHALYSMVLFIVLSNEDIFAAGNCYDYKEYPNKTSFCPYAHRHKYIINNTKNEFKEKEQILVKNLSDEYEYLDLKSEFFYEALKRGEKLLFKKYNLTQYMYYESEGIGLVNLTIPEITYYDGVWSSPYFDCGGGNIWMMTYTVPFFSYNRFSQKYHFKGTAGIDIDLYKMDINQCPNQSNSSNYNIFANTAKCKYETTYCENLLGFKFKRGSYRCVCKKGYYVQHVKDDVENEKINKNYFDGKQMEELFQLYQNDEYGEYYNSFNCLPCEMSCEECLSKKSCTVKINWTLRLSITIVHIVVGIIIIVCCTHFTIKFRKHDILKAASPELLYLILAGSVLLYLPGIINYFPLYYHQVCNLKVWIRKIGFSVTYGSLLLKSWRIVKIFFIRSAVVIKITNYKLYKMLCVILLVMSLYLCIRTFYGGSTIILVKKLNKQHTFQCSHTFWHYIDSLLELIILFYGITLCIQLRKIPSKFNESQYISWIIYNQTLSSLCLEMLTLFLASLVNPDLMFVFQFAYYHLTISAALICLFGSKVYMISKETNKNTNIFMK